MRGQGALLFVFLEYVTLSTSEIEKKKQLNSFIQTIGGLHDRKLAGDAQIVFVDIAIIQFDLINYGHLNLVGIESIFLG